MYDPEAIHAHAMAEVRARAAAIERAIEAALAGGVCGVLVDEEVCRAGPSLAVPYGEMHLIGTPNIGWQEAS